MLCMSVVRATDRMCSFSGARYSRCHGWGRWDAIERKTEKGDLKVNPGG
uniref:Uncharacterized protein n=1 Tax=Anguilla anguilla TaxID=7936 RepID=A0A0E9TD75_ANGAN